MPAASVKPIWARPAATSWVADTWGPPGCRVTSRFLPLYSPSAFAAKKPPPSGSAYQGSTSVKGVAPLAEDEDGAEDDVLPPHADAAARANATAPATAATRGRCAKLN